MTHQRRSALARAGHAAACGLITLGALSAPVLAQSAPDTSGKTVSLDVAASDLHTVVTMLERQAGVEALVRDGDMPFKPVNVSLKDAGLAKAMRTIAFSAGAKVSVNSDGIYVFEPGDGSASLSETPSASQAGSQSADGGGSDAPRHYAPGELQYRTIELQHAVPDDVLRLMHWDKDVVDMDQDAWLQARQDLQNFAVHIAKGADDVRTVDEQDIQIGRAHV